MENNIRLKYFPQVPLPLETPLNLAITLAEESQLR